MHDAHALPGEDVVADGVRLHVVRHGRSAHDDDPALLFVHGLGSGPVAGGRLWCDVARDLEHTHRSVIPDLAGGGRSERARRERCRPDGQAQLLLALLDVLEVERAVAVAHDLGGGVVGRLAALAPSRVAAVVLVATPLHDDAWSAALDRQIGSALPGPERVTGRAGALLRRFAPAYADASGLSHVRSSLAAADVPTLVLWGADDTVCPPDYGGRLAVELGATWVPVAGAGHGLPQGRPERVAEEVAGFLVEARIVV
jgi:pimeloyl-ACP methyl ester carboxylesterase